MTIKHNNKINQQCGFPLFIFSIKICSVYNYNLEIRKKVSFDKFYRPLKHFFLFLKQNVKLKLVIVNNISDNYKNDNSNKKKSS